MCMVALLTSLLCVWAHVISKASSWGAREGGSSLRVTGRWLDLASNLPMACSCLAMLAVTELNAFDWWHYLLLGDGLRCVICTDLAICYVPLHE